LIDEYSVDISKLTMTVDVLSGSKSVYLTNGTIQVIDNNKK